MAEGLKIVKSGKGLKGVVGDKEVPIASDVLTKTIKCKLFKEDNLKGLLSRVKASDLFTEPTLEIAGEPRVGANGDDIFPKDGKSFTLVDGEIEITIRKFG